MPGLSDKKGSKCCHCDHCVFKIRILHLAVMPGSCNCLDFLIAELRTYALLKWLCLCKTCFFAQIPVLQLEVNTMVVTFLAPQINPNNPFTRLSQTQMLLATHKPRFTMCFATWLKSRNICSVAFLANHQPKTLSSTQL